MTIEATIKSYSRNDGKEFCLIDTAHRLGVTATTAVSEQEFGISMGGIRFVKDNGESPEPEVCNLAAGMQEKCPAAGLPLDGQKTVIRYPDGVDLDENDKSEIIIEHIRAAKAKMQGLSFGPDIGVTEDILDSVADQDGLLASVTGLGERHGGLSIDDNFYTAFGLNRVLMSLLEERRIDKGKVTVQGLGAVGAPVAKFLSKEGFDVRAVNVEAGALIATGEVSIDCEELFAARLRMPKSTRDNCLKDYAERHPNDVVFESDPDSIFEVETDVFIPAARTNVLACRSEIPTVQKENPYVRSVEDYFVASGVSCVLEGANHPFTETAENYLKENGVLVGPDVLFNCGGVIGCAIEWANRQVLVADPTLKRQFDQAAKQFIEAVVQHNLHRLLDLYENGVSVRKAVQVIVENNRTELYENWQQVISSNGRVDLVTLVREVMKRGLINAPGFKLPVNVKT